MARKSRKQNNQTVLETVTPITERPERIRTAAYARVSIDKADENRDSIETQVLMIHQFVAEHPEYEIVDVYQDSGFTGTNFNRPEFSRLMDDIRIGRIQCVIVKDLSRFGRNFIETGYYIETIFPKLNARLISINDRFDSSRENDRKSLEIPIKNLVNAMYAVDASKKRVDAFILESRLGKTKIAQAPYGYVVDKQENKLGENPETARIVKAIFRWYIQGLTMPMIARRLNSVGAMIPSLYKEKMSNIKSNAVVPAWKALIVADVLRNPVYVGDTVQGRKRERIYKNEYIRHVDPEEWIVHKNTHQPLVSREDFEIVRQRLDKQKEERKESYKPLQEARKEVENCFRGKVFCADCGHSMQFSRFKHLFGSESFDGAYYICKSNSFDYCNKRISMDLLKVIVMDQVKVLLQVLCEQKGLAKTLLDGSNSKGKLLSGQKKLMNLKKKLAENEKEVESLYFNLADGVIDADDFRIFSKHYAEQKEQLHAQIKQQKDENLMYRKTVEHFVEFADRFDKFSTTMGYNQKLVDELIDRINVSSDTAVEIRFKCADELENYWNILREEENV